VIVWLAPAAIVGLLALGGPIAVHMLRRQQARRIVIPTLRFVSGDERSAARFRLPADPLLLVLRGAIVACAAVALAQPLALHTARTTAWDARTARAVIVDVSDSARGAGGEVAITSELSLASRSVRIDSTDPGASMAPAAAWLARAPPARREIVVFSDFQLGALSVGDVSDVPATVGLRFVPLPGEGTAQQPAAVRIVTAEGYVDARIALEAERTRVRYVPGRAGEDGLRIAVSAVDTAAVDRLRRVVFSAGAPAPSVAQPVVVRFPGADPLDRAADPTAATWTIGAGQRLLRSPDVAGIPIRVGADGGSLVIDAGVAPDSLAAARMLRAALEARTDVRALAEHEVERIPAATLAAWSREAAPADVRAWRQSEYSDGRWFWALALLLLGVETLVRRSPPRTVRGRNAHAA
jgi:hypothetical protein